MESLQMSILGFVLVVFGSFGRIWASLYIEGNKTKNLVTSGPFPMVNPLYFFSLIMLLVLVSIKSYLSSFSSAIDFCHISHTNYC